MKRYKYVAVNPQTDEVKREEITGKSKKEVESLVGEQGLELVLVEEAKGSEFTFDFSFGKKVSGTDLVNFTNELAIMLKAGIPIIESLQIAKEGTENEHLAQVIDGLKYSIQSGSSLSKALKNYPQVFSEVYIAMVEAGENSGNLSMALNNLADEIKRHNRLIKDVIGAMVYPAVIISALVLISIGMVAFVVPRIAEVYQSLAMDIPLSTKIFLTSGTFVANYWWLLLILIPLLIFLYLWGRNREGFKNFSQKVQSKIPVIKDINNMFNYLRFTRVLSILLKSGVQINSSVLIATKAVSDIEIRKSGKLIAKKLEEGVGFAKALEKEDIFPKTMVKMIEVGEKSGKLDSVLMDLSDYYSEELKDKLDKFIAIIEPVLIVIVGIAIGAMVISLLGPIYGVIGQIQ